MAQDFSDLRSPEGVRSVHITMPASAFGQLSMSNSDVERNYKRENRTVQPVSGQIFYADEPHRILFWCGTPRALDASKEN
jgi:hypothetical protein